MRWGRLTLSNSRRLDGGELGVQRDDRHAVPGLEVLHDRDEQGVDPSGKLDGLTVWTHEPCALRPEVVESPFEGGEHLGVHGVGTHFLHVGHGVDPTHIRNKCNDPRL